MLEVAGKFHLTVDVRDITVDLKSSWLTVFQCLNMRKSVGEHPNIAMLYLSDIL